MTIADQLPYWVQLNLAPLIATGTLKKLLAIFKTPEAVCNASTSQLRVHKLNDVTIQHIKHPNKKRVERTLAWATELNQHILPFTDSRYPALLAEIAQPPMLLYIKGQLTALHAPQIAMVGSRNPSHAGVESATQFAYQLSKAGLTITSGLAIGIDSAAHEGALAAQGTTIAVLGSGLDILYPKRNLQLSEKIIKNGCLVSEFPLHMPPKPENFPRRNRIISGLSLGTLIIEAALKSGSLITAYCALEQGREVFALPGSLNNPTAAGCLSLIQQGAKCVTQLSDIIEEINDWSEKTFPKEPATAPHALEQRVLTCIDREPTSIDQICERSKLSAQNVLAILLILELAGLVQPQLGGYIKVL